MNATVKWAYERFCTRRFPLPTEAEVADLERTIEMEFPADFREYLLEYNGGVFNEPDFRGPTEGAPEDCLMVLFGMHATSPHAQLGTKSSLSIFTDNSPPQVIPIGYTLMGNLLILMTDEEYFGAVVLKRAYSAKYFLLGNGIEEFFELLRAPSV
jgi:hypothetical protein